jgi:hypothetical protein
MLGNAKIASDTRRASNIDSVKSLQNTINRNSIPMQAKTVLVIGDIDSSVSIDSLWLEVVSLMFS